MKKSFQLLFIALCFLPAAYAQETDEPELVENSSTETEEAPAADASPSDKTGGPAVDKSGPKTMSVMAILGNEETPKSLVIVPWKSSEMGDELILSDTLDERAVPVDKEVFLRELNFYQIRSAEQRIP